MKTIYFAGGCFWGTEHYMRQFDGVVETAVGYANGHVDEPSYQQVYTDLTGHVECVRVVFDETVVSLRTLCRLFFRSIDPLSVNRQGEDVGTRYRTGIYWSDEEDRAVVEQVWQEICDRYMARMVPATSTINTKPTTTIINPATSGTPSPASLPLPTPTAGGAGIECRCSLAVEKLPLQCFYPAEEYHQDYLYKNPEGYCHLTLETLRLAKDYSQICRELRAYSRDDKRDILPRFFKTGKGEYGEGDMFLGVVVPDNRKIALKHADASFDLIAALLESEWHECRLCALLILVERFRKTTFKDEVVEFYLKHTAGINNWDLVDLSAPYILGAYLVTVSDRQILYDLACSASMWEQRIAIVSTLMLIRHGHFDDTMKLAEMFLRTKHDLMQKATGWMLREVGKRDEARLVGFLETYKSVMPRTMLRYALEKFSPQRRAYFMK
jgi:methionine-S-sulfoxide reductase